MFNKLKQKFEKNDFDNEEKNNSYGMDVVSSNEYSSSNYFYEKFKNNKDFKPLIFLGNFSKKTQYAISITLMAIGGIGAVSLYDKIDNDSYNGFIAKDELNKLNVELTSKNIYLQNVTSYLSKLSTVKYAKERMANKDFLNGASEKIEKHLEALNLKNSETVDFIEELKKITDIYKTSLDKFINNNLLIYTQLSSVSKLINKVDGDIENIINNKNIVPYLVDNENKKQNLFLILSEIKSIYMLMNNPSFFENIYSNKNNIIYDINNKTKQIDNLLREYNKINWNVNNNSALNFLNKMSTQINENLSRFFVEQQKFNNLTSNLIQLKVEDIHENLLVSLKSVEKMVDDKISFSQESFKYVHILLALFLLGFGLFFIIRSKFIEYEQLSTAKKLNDLLLNIEEIERDIDFYSQNKNHKINSNKSKKLFKLIDSINVMWDKNKQFYNTIQSLIEKIQKNNVKNDEIVEEIQEVEKVIYNTNILNSQEIEKFNKILIKNNEIYDYYNNNALNILQKNREIDDSVMNNVKVFNSLSEETSKMMLIINDLIKTGILLQEISNETKYLSEEAAVLSFNSEIISKRQNDNKNNAFVEISKNIKKISDKYLKISEKINNVTDNTVKNFEIIKTNLNKVEVQIARSKTNSELLKNKHETLKPIENKIKDYREEFDKLFKQVNLVDFKSNLNVVNEKSKELEKSASSYSFNASLNNDSINDILKLIEIKKDKKGE